jgi:hypothetical protein
MSFTQKFGYPRTLIFDPAAIPIVHKSLVSLQQLFCGLVKRNYKGLRVFILAHLRIGPCALGNQTTISLSRSKFS